jgi:hypothetical protein
MIWYIKWFIIPNTLQKLNFLQHIHVNAAVCGSCCAHTRLWQGIMQFTAHFSACASTPPLCALNFRTKKENSARRSPEFSILPLRLQLLRQIWDSVRYVRMRARWITHSRLCEKILCHPLFNKARLSAPLLLLLLLRVKLLSHVRDVQTDEVLGGRLQRRINHTEGVACAKVQHVLAIRPDDRAHQPQLFVINERAARSLAPHRRKSPSQLGCLLNAKKVARIIPGTAERPKPDQTRAQIERLVSARLFSLGRAHQARKY